MHDLARLRRLVDLQQHAELQTAAKHALEETHDARFRPLLALACIHLGQGEQARQAYAEATAQLDALDLDARVDLAGAACFLHRFDDATRLLEVALLSEPDHALALARLAWCRMIDGNHAEAESLYRRAAELAPERLPVWIALARLNLRRNVHDQAQHALDAGLARLHTAAPELPVAAARLFDSQMRCLQLEIWAASERLAQAEQWIEASRDTLSETDWVFFVTGYATLLAGQDRHASAEELLQSAREHYPENLELLSKRIELAQLRGRTGQVVRLLHLAIQIANKRKLPDVPYWVLLSSAFLPVDSDRSRMAADRAVAEVKILAERGETPPDVLRQLRLQAVTALARVESQEQNFPVAEKFFGEVLAEDKDYVPALQGLGHQHLQCGRIDAAVALFDRIKQIDPATGYASLINARQFPEDEATLTRLEEVARQPSLEGRIRADLLLLVAQAREKRREYDRAFALAREANQANRKLLRYDAQAHRNACARIRHAFCSALFERRRGCGVESTLPVYVVGMPRSGTTLVEQIIAGHSRIFGAGELGVIPQRVQGLNRWERHTGSGRSYPDCIDDLTAELAAGLAHGILEELRAYAPAASHVVDKLPHNFEHIGFIKLLFPRARIISVRRDPRDIALSNYFTNYQAKHGGMGFAYDLGDIGEQLADHNLLMHHWHQLFPGEILEVRYEDVVDDTEAAARKLLDYIGVEWEPGVLAFDKLDRPVKTASVWQVRQPIYTTSKARWEHYRDHLAPLVEGCNAKIVWDPIEMTTLPEPGLLTAAIEAYKQEQFAEAEYTLKKLLHHLPDHASANFMLGLIYLRHGILDEGVALMEKGYSICSWNADWSADLIQAYEMVGATDKAHALKTRQQNFEHSIQPSE